MTQRRYGDFLDDIRQAAEKAVAFLGGMALGEFSMAVLWTVISAVAGIPAPQFPWP